MEALTLGVNKPWAQSERTQALDSVKTVSEKVKKRVWADGLVKYHSHRPTRH
jgi:hypothetical protein